MKISVVTVTRNGADSLPEALRSVAMQSFFDVEHIVIDGASTDNTADVMRLYGAHVNRFVSEPDRGIYDAMNKGLKLVTGDVVGFLNADDQYADPKVLESVAETMEAEGLDIIFGDVAFFRGNNSRTIIRRYRSDRFHPGLLSWGWMPAHPAFFMRREIYRRIGLFKIDYKIAGDYEMMVRIFQSHNLKFKYIPKVLVLMKLGGVSNSGWRSFVQLNAEVLRACRENGVSTNIFKILSKYPLKMREFIGN